MHLFWLALLVPAVILGQWIWPVLKLRSLWSVGVLAVGVVIVIWLAMGFSTLGGQRGFDAVLKMFAFRLVAFTDLPLVQLLVACGVGWFFSARVRNSRRLPKTESVIDQPVPGV